MKARMKTRASGNTSNLAAASSTQPVPSSIQPATSSTLAAASFIQPAATSTLAAGSSTPGASASPDESVVCKYRLGYVHNPRSLMEGTETLSRDDIGDLLGSPDHL